MTVLPEVITGGTTTGHDAHHVELHADYNKRNRLEYVVDVPAAGSSTSKDKAAVGAAVTWALAQTDSAKVKFGPGTYDVGDLADIVLPAYGSGPTLHFEGDNAIGTTLFFSIDQGAGKYAVSLGGTEFDLYFHTFEHMRCIGPGVRGALGSPPVNTIGGGPTLMSGIQVGSRMKLLNGACGGFRSGVEFKGNHSTLRNWDSNNNYDGGRFAADPANSGDILPDHCDFSGNLRGSLAVSNTAVATYSMLKGHLGFSPYAVYFEAGRTSGSGLALGGVTFFGTSIEEVGNSFFYDPDHMARVITVTFVQVGNWSRDFATYGISSVTTNQGIYLRDFADIHFIDGFPLGVADGALIDVTNVLQMETNQWKASYDASVTAGKPWILFGGVGAVPEVDLRERQNWHAIACQNDTTANITAGMVLEMGGAINGVRPWRYYSGTNTGPLAGIALNSVSTSVRELVVCVTNSYSVPVLIDGAPASAFQVVASTATVGKATGVIYDGTDANTLGRPLIGQTTSGGAVPTGASTTNCRVRIP